MAQEPRKGAHVEIIDTYEGPEDARILVPSLVRINGVDMGLIAEDGIEICTSRRRWWQRRTEQHMLRPGLSINAGNWENATTVTITLLPRLVEVKAELPQSPAEELRSAQQAHSASALRLNDAQRAARATGVDA